MVKMILDTEFVSLGKPFIYNLGYVIVDYETGEILAEKDFVIEQIWHNRELFATAYYANKRNLYVSRMRGRKVNLVKWGECMRLMIKDIKTFGVSEMWAYNVKADYSAINFMIEWFGGVRNPLELVNSYDIYAVSKYVLLPSIKYNDFCEKNNMLTKRGNPKCTAESCYAFLTNNPSYKEEHTALSDSYIEMCILYECSKISMDENFEILRKVGERWVR